MQEKNITPLTRGLSFDMQQLSSDQEKLFADYKKATDQLSKKFKDSLEDE